MIQLIIFDLDGVLIDSKNIHFEALNSALAALTPGFRITKEEHLATYDGLPTREKLKLLTKKKGLPTFKHADIAELKAKATVEVLKDLPINDSFIDIFSQLKQQGYKIAIASNAVRSTVQQSLQSLALTPYVDVVYSNQDVKYPKPHFEMYFKCMLEANAGPKETLILEDSHIGRQAVLDAGCHLLPIIDSNDVSLEKINNKLDELNTIESISIPWRSNKMNILIPMAGAGSRFVEAGYTFPKPLIEVGNKPMIQTVVDNINIDAHHIFIVQKEHYEKYNLKTVLELIKPNCTIIQIEGVTEGAACTTLLAKEYINNDEPLVIANSDQFVEWNSNEIMYAFSTEGIDGGILTFQSTHPKWSYAKTNETGFVSEVAEKKPISTNATVGIYYWKKGSDYVRSAEQMIEKDIRTNNEFYVCPTYNELIAEGKKIRIKNIAKMWGLGTPEDLNNFLDHYNGQY